VHGEEAEDDPRRAPGVLARALVSRDEEERDGRPERRPHRIAETVQERARGGRGGEHGERRAAMGDERERGGCSQGDAKRIEAAICVAMR
jgi:hypothetical protein